MLPRRPILIISPSRAGFVGSPTTQASSTSPSSASQRSILAVPLIAAASSSPVISRLIEPGGGPSLAMSRATAAAKAAIAPFMSAAPRPNSRPSTIRAANGSCDQAARSPTGTTSVWPAKQKLGAAVPSRAYRLSTSGVPASEKVRRRQTKPMLSSAACRVSSAPASAGVTLGQRISARASAMASTPPAAGPVGAAAFVNGAAVR